MRTDLVSKDETMHVIMDNRGGKEEVAFIPDDFFEEYAIPVEEWVLKPLVHENDFYQLTTENSSHLSLAKLRVNIVQTKLQRATMALDLYNKAGGSGGLRIPMMVIENYVPTEEEGVIHRYFMFKEDNNGTTYRISDRFQISGI